jgi:DNA-binding transcriptional ArsR family regulator
MRSDSNLLSDALTEEVARTFRVLADPTRVRILGLLLHREQCVSEIARRLGMSVSAVSHQLGLLRSLRLVRRSRRGKRAFYALDDDHVRTLFHDALEHAQEKRHDG